jgi:hypothetical protein
MGRWVIMVSLHVVAVACALFVAGCCGGPDWASVGSSGAGSVASSGAGGCEAGSVASSGAGSVASSGAGGGDDEGCDASGYGGAAPGESYDAGPICGALCAEHGLGNVAYICGDDLHCEAPFDGCEPVRGPQQNGASTGEPTTDDNATAYCCLVAGC